MYSGYRKLLVSILSTIFFVSAVPGDRNAVVDGNTHNGVEIQIDLPESQHVRNFGAPRDGKGLCVFATMDMIARWHNIRPLFDVINKVESGGGWPEKVDEVARKFAPDLKIVQYQGKDLTLLENSLQDGRPVAVTYGYGERYGMKTIYHMVMLVHLDSEYAAILDNNFPGTYEWMPRQEFARRWIHPGGYGWAYVFLAHPPPPVPAN